MKRQYSYLDESDYLDESIEELDDEEGTDIFSLSPKS